MSATYSGDLAKHLRTYASKFTDGDISAADLNRIAAVSIRFLSDQGRLRTDEEAPVCKEEPS
jgi:hypothetical protein